MSERYKDEDPNYAKYIESIVAGVDRMEQRSIKTEESCSNDLKINMVST